MEVEPSTFAAAVDASSDRKIVILGDISGSMGGGKLMQILKKSFHDICEKSLRDGCPDVEIVFRRSLSTSLP